MNPEEAVQQAEQWVGAFIAVLGLLAIAVTTFTKFWRDARKKLDAVLRVVEKAGKPAKMAVCDAEIEEGINLDKDIERATGKRTKRNRKTAGLIAFLLILPVIAGCCNHTDFIAVAAKHQRVNEGHAADESLPPLARLVGQDNGDAWAVHRYALGGPKPSAEVLKRVKGE